MSSIESLQDWFSLKNSNYKLSPKTNSEHRKFFAKRTIANNDIQSHLDIFDRDLLANITPKRLYYGNAGSGKSHLMLHVADHLESEGFFVCYVECPPLKPTDMPIVLFKEFVDKIGRREIIDYLQKSYDNVMQQASKDDPEFYKNPRERAYPLLQKKFIDDSLIDVVSSYVNKEEKHTDIAKWLKGEKLKELAIENLTDNTSSLAKVFVTILKLMNEISGKKTVLIFDELDNMNQIPEKLVPQYSHVFRELTEDSQEYAAIVLCFTGESQNENEIINEHVKRRILDSNIIEIKEIKQGELENFCSDLIAYNRAEDNSFIDEQCKKYKDEASDEGIDSKYYPFTLKAIDKMKTVMVRAKPGDIINTLNQSCAEAKSQDRHVVRSDDVESVIKQKRTVSQN